MLNGRQACTSVAKRDAGVALAAVLTDLPVPGTFGGVDRLLTRQRTCRKETASGTLAHARGSQVLQLLAGWHACITLSTC